MRIPVGSIDYSEIKTTDLRQAMFVCIDVKEWILFFFLLLYANCLGSAWSINQTFQFEKQYILDKTFAASFEFQDVTDIAISLLQNHILVFDDRGRY